MPATPANANSLGLPTPAKDEAKVFGLALHSLHGVAKALDVVFALGFGVD